MEYRQVVPKATKLNVVMKTHKLNFNQAMGWIQPEMQTWLLQGPQLSEDTRRLRLPAPIFLNIATFLCASTIPETRALGNRLFIDKCPERLNQHLLVSKLSNEPPLKKPLLNQ